MEILSTIGTSEIVEGNYVATGTTRLRSGTIIGLATLSVPARAVDPAVVRQAAVEKLQQGLEQAVQALAVHDAKINGRWAAP